MSHQIVFNLYPCSETLYLPSANIVQADSGGQLLHVLQKATPATIVPYGFALTPDLQKLFDAIDALTPKNIEVKYKPFKAKTPPSLSHLLEDAVTKPAVEAYIHRLLDGFLGEIVRQNRPLTLDAERKTLAKDVLLTQAAEELIPHLSFKKTPDGIEYRLQLGTETERWDIQAHDVVPLTNTDPAWLLVGYTLFRAPGINGNMVRPFRKKAVLQIPADKERLYFRQFIAKSVRRSRVEAEGFRVVQTDALRATRLEIVENILEKRRALKLSFEYDGAIFNHGERRDRITSIEIPKDDAAGEISVHLICRNTAAEQQRAVFLKETKLYEAGGLFYVEGAEEDGFREVLDYLVQNGKTLGQAGFQVVPPEIDGKTLALLPGDLSVRSEAAGDWFDILGQVQVGDHSFPFHAFLHHLRRGDRFFRLPDDTWFLIPDAWFSRYGDLAQSVQELPGDVLRLPKALYTVLQGADPEAPEAYFPLIDPDAIEYTPSPDLKAELRPYQTRGVQWLIGHYRHGFGACLADDMGLGKTLQTIALLLYAKAEGGGLKAKGGGNLQLDLFAQYQEEIRPLRALIILPASLVFNWQRELAKFAPSLYVYIHTGPKRLKDARALAGHDATLTTYHTARQDLALLEKVDWQFIVLDESQQIKNRESEVSKVVRSLKGKHKISLSGTPIENSLADLWTQMEFINPATLGSFKSFREQFLIPIEKQNDEQAKTRLFGRVRPFFMRRTKEEVAPDLPALTEQVFYTEMSTEQKKCYEQIKSAVRNEILSLFDDPKTRFMALQALLRLRQIANHPVLADRAYTGDSGKFEDVWAQWDTVRRSGHKVLFFSSFVEHLRLFQTIFEREKMPYAWLTGETAPADRAREVTRFQDDASVQAFFMTVKAGGVGLNLTAADYVFLLDPWWNPAAEDQAVARAHRIGQERPVTALRFIARDSIEEKIRQLQERKKLLGKALFATGAEAPELSREDLEGLLA
jgi:SNF2-related domain/Helicase conserved C-terminal domain